MSEPHHALSCPSSLPVQPIATAVSRCAAQRASSGAHRLVVGIVVLGALAAGPLLGQVSPAVPGRPADPGLGIQVYAYTFQNKSAAEALPLVQPLLTKRGSIELQPEDNTLVIRDTVAALGRIVPTLRAFDRPPQELRIEVMIVRAGTQPVLTPGVEQLPDWLEARLRGLLRWDYYSILARSGLVTHEGQEVTHEVGRLYGLSFRPGTLQPGNQIKLNDFRIWHVGHEKDEPLLEATLNLWLGKPKVLGLANSESADRALMVVLTCERRDEAADRGAGIPPARRPEGKS